MPVKGGGGARNGGGTAKPKPKYRRPATSRSDAASPNPRPAPKKAYKRPSNSRSDAAQGRTPSQAARPYKLPSGPRADSPSTRKGDFKKAAAQKKTPGYKRTVKEAYAGRSLEERKKRVARAEKGRRQAAEDIAVLDMHRDRAATRQRELDAVRNSVGGDSPATRAADMGRRFDRTVASKGYQDLLAEARDIGPRSERIRAREDDKEDARRGVNQGKGASMKNAGGAPAFVENIGKTAAATALAVYHDPIGVPSKTAAGVPAMVKGAIPGIVDAATHPIKTGKSTLKDYDRRYSGSVKDRVKRIRKEGALAEIADASILLPAAGIATRAGVVGLGGKTVARAGNRVSGGMVTPRKTSRNQVTYLINKKSDQVRGKRLEKRLVQAKDNEKGITVEEYAAATANRRAGRVVEVTPRTLKRNKAQRVSVARARAQSISRLKTEQGLRHSKATKTINRLKPKERDAFWFTATYGIKTGGEKTVARLEKMRDDIKASRESANVRVAGRLKDSDMLPQIERILADPAAHFTPALREAIEELRPSSLKAAAEDPRYIPEITEARRVNPQRDFLGLRQGGADAKGRYNPDESAEAFAIRVSEAIEAADLADPIYLRSERFTGDNKFAARAVGGGRAMQKDGTYKGRNTALGLQDTRPEVFTDGLMRNIKAKHNYKLITDILDQHRMTDLAPPEGAKLFDLQNRLADKGIDEDSVGFWNAGIYKRSIADHKDADGNKLDASEDADAVGVVDAFRKAQDTTLDTSGWQIVPKAALKELEDQVTPSGAGGRSWDIGKGFASRTMLGWSPPWLGAQIAGNTLMAGAATGGKILNPATMIGARKWWKGLSDEDRADVGAILGLDSTNAITGQVKMGAASDRAFVNSWRAMKAHPFWHTGIAKGRGPSVSELSIPKNMFIVDRKQTNAFRIGAGYANARGLDIKMGKSRADIDALVTAKFKDPVLAEKHAKRVNDWMGDYATMTARERTYLNRSVMFYSYVRYATKLIFKTLPVEHPMIAGTLATLGQLHEDEIRKMFGDDDDTFRRAGKFWYGKEGSKSIDLSRINPGMTALMDVVGSDNAGGLTGIAPPPVGALLDQAFHGSAFFDRNWTVEGLDPKNPGKDWGFGSKSGDYSGETRGRIFADDVLSVAYPYRTAKKLTQGDEFMGDDSLPWSERPMKFSAKKQTPVQKLKADNAKANQIFKAKHESFADLIAPYLPQENREVADSRVKARVKQLEDAPKKSRKKAGPQAKRYGTSP